MRVLLAGRAGGQMSGRHGTVSAAEGLLHLTRPKPALVAGRLCSRPVLSGAVPAMATGGKSAGAGA